MVVIYNDTIVIIYNDNGTILTIYDSDTHTNIGKCVTLL